MRRLVAVLATLYLSSLPLQHATAQTNVRVGWYSRTISAAVAPFAIATKLGWYAKEGIKLDLVPLPGGSDCTKFVATGEISEAPKKLRIAPLFLS